MWVDKTLAEMQRVAEPGGGDAIYVTSEFLKKFFDKIAITKPEELENIIAMLEFAKFRWLARIYEAERS